MHFDVIACGKRIKEARCKKGLTQLDLSEALHISAKYLSRIETGAQCASLNTIIDIAEQLNTSIDILVLGKSNNTVLFNADTIIELRNIILRLSVIVSSILDT